MTTGQAPIRIVVVDDHTLFRRGIISLLSHEAGFAVVGEASDGFEGIRTVLAQKPDVVLLDLNMQDAEDLVTALRSGAQGYLLKNIDSEFLVRSLRRAAQGESVISPEMAGKLMRQVRTGVPNAQPADVLSPREREIVQRLAKGGSNKEIARDLDLAESTVKIHVQHILRKLGLNSRVQAAVWAIENGIAARQ